MTDEHLGVTQFRQAVEALENGVDSASMVPPSPTHAQLCEMFGRLTVVHFEELVIDGGQAPVEARLYRPADAVPVTSALVWVHGGAFVFGDLTMPEAHWVSLELAQRGVAVLSVEYRKALGANTYPAASDDVLTAWQWACAHRQLLGGENVCMHIGGASAGGNLAAGVTKRLRDGAGQLPASAVLIYPLIHPELPNDDGRVASALETMPNAMDFPPEVTAFINLHYVGTSSGLDDPYAFAANGDVSGQPPIYILNSEADRLRLSGEAYGDQLRAAGVEVTVEMEPGTGHGHLNEPNLETAHRSIGRIADWLARFYISKRA